MTLKLKGYARNPDGSAMPTKAVTIYNSADSYLGGGGGVLADKVTQADGSWEYTGLDETVIYRVKVAAGGQSSDKAVWDLFSGQAEDLQIRGALRFAAAAAAVTLPVGSAVGATPIIHAHPYSADTHLHDARYALLHSHPYSLDSHVHGTAPAHDHATVYTPLAHMTIGDHVRAVNGNYSGSGLARTIQSIPGVPILGMIWESNGSGQGGTWFMNGQNGTVGFGVATGADEFVNASGHVSIHTGSFLVGQSGGNNGLGANMNSPLTAYTYMILYFG